MIPRALLLMALALWCQVRPAIAIQSWFNTPDFSQSEHPYTVEVGDDVSDYIDVYRDDGYIGSADMWSSPYYPGSSYGCKFSQVFTDTGPAQVVYSAASYDWWAGNQYSSYAITIGPGNIPEPSVAIDGRQANDAIVKPYGTNVVVTVRFKATDPNGDLTGILPYVWHQASGYLNNNGGAYIAQSGSSGEVVWTVTLDRDGDWYFWTYAKDALNSYNYMPGWTGGFRLNVSTAPNQSPNFSLDNVTGAVPNGQTLNVSGWAADPELGAPVNRVEVWIDGTLRGNAPLNGDRPDVASVYGRSDYRYSGFNFSMGVSGYVPGAHSVMVRAYDNVGAYSQGDSSFTVPNTTPAVGMAILDSNHNPVGLDGNGRARLAIGSQFFVRVNGSDPDERLARLYSRVNNSAGAGFAYEQVDVSGSAASHDFGPYLANSLGIWDVWAHSEDQDQTGYQWMGGGWAGTQSPDIEVYQPNRPPDVSLTINGVSSSGGQTNSFSISNGSQLPFTVNGSDPDGNFQRTRIWANFENQGWTEIFNTTSGAISSSYSLSGVGSWQFHCRSIDSDGVESSTAIINVQSTNRPPSALLSADRTSAFVGESISLTLGVDDPDGGYDYSNLWVKTPNTDWRWIRENNALVLGGALDRNQPVTAYGSSGSHGRAFPVVLSDGFGEYRFSLAVVDVHGARTNAQDVVVTVANRAPTVTMSALPTTVRLGESVSVSSTAGDADGNLSGHWFWMRGARPADNFSADWDGWTDGPRNGVSLPNGWSGVTPALNYNTPASGSSNSISASVTPTAPGYWQFHANVSDAAGVWGSGGTTGAVFVAPPPTTTISVTLKNVVVSGGGTLHMNTSEVLTVASSASASGWLSEHNIYGLQDGSFFAPNGGAAWLSGLSTQTDSARSIQWQPSIPGNYTLYVESFTGRSGGERVNGHSGYPGYFNDGSPDSERVVVIVHPPVDTDGDGIVDSWELQNGFDANDSADASLDPDADGLTNLAEYNLGKSPNVYDSGTSQLGANIPAGWPAADTTTLQAVGATAGELSVDKGGATTYQIPIAASPGTAGMQPSLSLSYSSQAGAGIAGFGWSLTGLSAISRGPQTMAVDGQVRGIDFTNQDRFYLDGQRLIPISGANGADGTEYRTEIDSFSRIVSYGYSGNGPARWRVWTKAGLVVELGYTGDSQFRPYRKTGGSFSAGAEALTWSVSRIYDTAGNYMSFSYAENESEGSQLLTRIDYTGHLDPLVSPYASVRFEYEARPDTSVGYSAGARLVSNQRLKNVRAYYGETVVRTYSLSYTERTHTQRSLLASLTETGSDGKSYHPLVFEYAEPSQGWQEMDKTRWAPPVQFLSYSGYLNRPQRYGTGFADLDGDGRPDILQWYHDSSGANDHRRTAWMNLPASSNSTNWFGLTSAQPPFPLAYKNRNDTGARMVDFDGDGLLDMIWFHVQSNGAVESEAYRNSGNHWNEGYGWHSMPQYRSPFPLGQDNANPAFSSSFVDLNGDGRVDLIGRTDNTNHAYLNNGSGWQQASQWNAPCYLGDGTSFLDLNGDGLPDLVQNWYGDNQSKQGIWFNNGNGWTACPQGELGNYLPPLMTASNPDYGRNSPVGTEFTDLNGDGLVDCIARNDAAGNYIAPQAWLNTGRGWERFTSYDPPLALRHDHISRGTVFIDVNADGLVDFVRSYSGGSHVYYNTGRGWSLVDGTAILPMNVYVEGWHNENLTDLVDLDADGAIDQAGHWGDDRGAYRNLANPSQDRLVKVKNAFGVEARITYSPLTARDAQTGDFSIYDKGVGSVFPKVEVIAPMYVTKSVSHDDGAGGQYEINYRYGGLRSHAYRGSLGFEWMQSTDARTGIRSTTWFKQDYPFVGMPSASETRTASSTLLSQSIVTYDQKSLNGGASRFPYANESIQRSYELDGTLVSESITTSQYDDWGNATRLEIDSLDGHEKVTVSTYDNWIQPASESGLGGWLLGRLSRSTVTAMSPVSPSQTRVSSFGYHSTTGLLTSEVVEPDRASDPANYTLTTTYGHDAFGNKTSVSTTGGGLATARTATTVYDTRGRFPVSTVNALNHGESYTYDEAKGVVLTTTGPNNLTTTWEYDGFVRKIKETRADNTVTNIRYGWPGAGAPAGTKYFIETESSGGPPAIACYDAMGRGFMGYSINGGKIDGNARIVVQKTEYDSMGRAYRGSLPYYLNEAVPGWIETTAYDVLSRPLTVTTPNDDVAGGLAYSSVTYAGLVTTTTNAKGQIERIEKNSQGQVARRVNNAGAAAGSVERGEVSYTYDAFGQLLTTTVYKENGSQVSTSLTYDVRGRKTSMVDPDMGTWSYLYNAAGELTWQKDAKNQETSMQYDVLGRLVRREERVVAGANPVVTVWAYDTAAGAALGKLHTITTTGDGANASVGNNETYAYDSLGRVNQSTRLINGQSFTQHQSFDSFGRPLVSTYPSGFQVKNVYNALGFLKEVRRADSGLNDLYWAADSYALDGRVNGEYFGNGMAVDRVYSQVTGRLRISQSGVSFAATRAQDLSYTYDVLGNVTSRTDNAMGRSETFGYDGLNRLINHTVAGGAVVTLSYDSLGNITQKSDAGSYTYDGTRHHAVNNTSGGVGLLASAYAYDGNGNMTSGAGRTYTWTLANQMKRAEKAGIWSEFQFDASRQRVLQTNNLGQTTYYVSGSFEEVRHSGGLIERKYYVSAPTGRVAVRVERSSGVHETRWFHSDGLGSINAISDERGAIVQRFAYDAWGKRTNPANGAPITSGTNSGVSRGYTDHEHLDDLGLIHMNGRVFDPVLGRFISADPIVQDVNYSQTYNRFSYCINNPLAYTDPSGFSFWDKLKKTAKLDFFLPGVATDPLYWFAPKFHSQYAGQALGMAVTIVVSIYAGPVAGGAAGGFASGFASSLLNGASVGDSFRAGVIGGVQGAIMGAVTSVIGGYYGEGWQGWTSELGRASAHGVVGGVYAEATGGDFGVGFAGSFIGSISGHAANKYVRGSDLSAIAGRTIIAATAGGTVSVIGGGKFANGAYTAAFQHLLNNESKNLIGLAKEGASSYRNRREVTREVSRRTLTAEYEDSDEFFAVEFRAEYKMSVDLVRYETKITYDIDVDYYNKGDFHPYTNRLRSGAIPISSGVLTRTVRVNTSWAVERIQWPRHPDNWKVGPIFSDKVSLEVPNPMK